MLTYLKKITTTHLLGSAFIVSYIFVAGNSQQVYYHYYMQFLVTDLWLQFLMIRLRLYLFGYNQAVVKSL